MEWFIIVLLTMSTGETSEKILTNLRFKTENSCQKYVIKNYEKLNVGLNKDYEQHESTPNLYRCVIGKP